MSPLLTPHNKCGFAETRRAAATRAMLLRRAARSTFSAAAGVREPKDLHAAWASLAAYDSKAAGTFLNRKADEAKAALNAAGFELAREFVVHGGKAYHTTHRPRPNPNPDSNQVHGGKAMSFDGKEEVDETDAAYLWLRQADGRTLLAFRGYATQASNPRLADPRQACYSHVRALSWTARTRRRILCTCAERPTLAPASCTATTCTPVRPTWLEP